MTEAPSHLSIPEQETDNWSPERIFDVRWAATVVERALRRLSDECEERGRRRVFDALSSCLTAERQDVSYATLARILGIQETAVKNLVHRLRERYRALLREEVAETVSGENEIDDELRYLCAALSAAKSTSRKPELLAFRGPQRPGDLHTRHLSVQPRRRPQADRPYLKSMTYYQEHIGRATSGA